MQNCKVCGRKRVATLDVHYIDPTVRRQLHSDARWRHLGGWWEHTEPCCVPCQTWARDYSFAWLRTEGFDEVVRAT